MFCSASTLLSDLGATSLIKLNRERAVQETLQRFAGWATSIPLGGSNVVDKADERESVRRGVAGLPFEERRVVIDEPLHGAHVASELSWVFAGDQADGGFLR